MLDFKHLALQMTHAIAVQVDCTIEQQPLYFLLISTFYDVFPLRQAGDAILYFTDLQSAEVFSTTCRRELQPTRSLRVQAIAAAEKARKG